MGINILTIHSNYEKNCAINCIYILKFTTVHYKLSVLQTTS